MLMKTANIAFFLIIILSPFAIVKDGFAQDIKRKGQKPDFGSFSKALGVTPMSAGVTAQQMVENLLGEGISYQNVQYTGASVASGLFTGGSSAGINIDEGVILSCGAAQFAIGPNNSPGISQVNGLPGDADLNSLGYSTNDASVLEFDFTPELDYISFNFVIGSEEYPEFITGYQDVFAFFLDGVNIALIPGTNTTISIGTVNHLQNSQYYISNSESPPPYDIQCDGFTVVFELVASVTPNVTHHIKMAVADANDSSLDTWIFLEGGSFVSANPGIVVDPLSLNESLCPDANSTQYFTITNDGTGELTFTIDENETWLSVNPNAGSIQEGENLQIEVLFNSNGMAAGSNQTNIQIINNTPQSPFSIPVSLDVLPLSSTLYINDDNENNSLGGSPDGDFNTFLCKGDEILPIEFNIFIEQPSIESAELGITTFDVDLVPDFGLPYPQEDEVYVNGNFVGVLSGADETQAETVFNVPASFLVPGPNGKNLIQIFASVKGKFWCLQMNSAELTITHCQGK